MLDIVTIDEKVISLHFRLLKNHPDIGVLICWCLPIQDQKGFIMLWDIEDNYYRYFFDLDQYNNMDDIDYREIISIYDGRMKA